MREKVASATAAPVTAATRTPSTGDGTARANISSLAGNLAGDQPPAW
jgi:hypothetical protein